jgi:hypothetical protein
VIRELFPRVLADVGGAVSTNLVCTTSTLACKTQ